MRTTLSQLAAIATFDLVSTGTMGRQCYGSFVHINTLDNRGGIGGTMTKRATWKAVVLSTAALAMPGVAISAGSASTAPAPDSIGPATDTGRSGAAPPTFVNKTLRSEATAKCVTRAGAGTGVAVVQRTCNIGAVTQRWTSVRLSGSGPNAVYHIRNGNHCLEAYANIRSEGAALTVSPCVSNLPKQRWNLRGAPGGNVAMSLAGVGDECVDVPASSSDEAKPLIHWQCAFTSSANQRWTTA